MTFITNLLGVPFFLTLYFFFKQSVKKKGTPKIDVITPAGNSPGAMQTLAKVSASNSKVAPKIILTGTRIFPRGPKNFLQI